MKHAICVIGYGNNATVLQKTIQILDDKDIDFIVHWDARYNLPALTSKFSKIYFVRRRRSVKWGSSSQIKATLLLLKLVSNLKSYDYVHLISCNDIPLMTKDYFKKFFKAETYIGFSKNFKKKEAMIRVGYYYPANLDFRKNFFLTGLIQRINKILGTNRLKKFPNINIKKGPQWFSIRSKYIYKILNFNNSVFMHGYCVDELFIQTILSQFESSQIKSKDDNKQALRYIDWKRGTPYVFTINDVDELKHKVNTQYAFARKINDPKVPMLIFNI